MPHDDDLIEDLVQTAEDGRDGYAKGAEELAKGDHTELAAVFQRYSEQRD